MSVTTVTLNPGTGGAKELHDSIDTVDGAAAPDDAVSQVVKQAYGAAGEAFLVSDDAPLPVGLSAAQFASFVQSLQDIAQALGPLLTARSPADGMLRVNVNGNNTLGTLTTLTTVTTLSNQTSIGGYTAAPMLPALFNGAAVQANIDRMVG